MGKAVRVYETGGAEVLRLEDVDMSPPDAGFVTVSNQAIERTIVIRGTETYLSG